MRLNENRRNMSFTFCQKLAVVQPSHGLKNNGQVVKNLRNNVSYSSKTPGILELRIIVIGVGYLRYIPFLYE